MMVGKSRDVPGVFERIIPGEEPKVIGCLVRENIVYQMPEQIPIGQVEDGVVYDTISGKPDQAVGIVRVSRKVLPDYL